MKKAKVYSHDLVKAVEARMPPSIIEAMARCGWNPLGVYEVVAEELKKEKEASK